MEGDKGEQRQQSLSSTVSCVSTPSCIQRPARDSTPLTIPKEAAAGTTPCEGLQGNPMHTDGLRAMSCWRSEGTEEPRTHTEPEELKAVGGAVTKTQRYNLPVLGLLLSLLLNNT